MTPIKPRKPLKPKKPVKVAGGIKRQTSSQRTPRQIYMNEFVSTHNHEFYSSSEWRRLREHVLRRDGFKCVDKGHNETKPRSGITLYVDHIIPLNVAPERRLDITNLQTLCASCHTNKTNHDRSDAMERDYWARMERNTSQANAKPIENINSASELAGDGDAEPTEGK